MTDRLPDCLQLFAKNARWGRGFMGRDGRFQVNLRVRKFDLPGKRKLYTTLHFIPNFRFVSNFPDLILVSVFIAFDFANKNYRKGAQNRSFSHGPCTACRHQDGGLQEYVVSRSVISCLSEGKTAPQRVFCLRAPRVGVSLPE